MHRHKVRTSCYGAVARFSEASASSGDSSASAAVRPYATGSVAASAGRSMVMVMLLLLDFRERTFRPAAVLTAGGVAAHTVCPDVLMRAEVAVMFIGVDESLTTTRAGHISDVADDFLTVDADTAFALLSLHRVYSPACSLLASKSTSA